MESENRKQEHHQVVIDGNAFYEIDLDCVREKQKEKEKEERIQERRQRR